MTTNRWGHIHPFVVQERSIQHSEHVVDTSNAKRARRRLVRRRIVRDGERTYTAYSADELIALDRAAREGRPGHLY